MPRRKRRTVRNRITVEHSSGNIFADIGLPNPDERLAKADLAIRITEAICAQRLTRTQAARVFGIDQPSISRFLRGQLSGLSTKQLAKFLTWLAPASK